MNQKEAKWHGVHAGVSAALYCEVDKTDRREAGCDCVASNYCEECLTSAAYEAEMSARDFAPWEFIASDINACGERSEGLWHAYDEGVGIGIRSGVKKRLQRDADAARRLQATIDKQALKNSEVTGVDEPRN